MIFDRTQAIVDEAIRIRAEKESKLSVWNALPVEEKDAYKSILARGFVRYDTLNRIEEAEAALVTDYNDMGYFNANITTQEWNVTDIISDLDLYRIINNLDILRSAFYIYSSTPQTPRYAWHWEVFNAIEKIIADMQSVAADIPTHYRRCGTFNCGE